MRNAPRILVTAGPTHEPIDRVRYIANRSSGRLGIELARAAVAAECPTRLLLGPVTVSEDSGAECHRFTSAADLESLLATYFPCCDVLIMAAAVADYRPQQRDVGKLPREGRPLQITLVPTPDLVAACAGRKRPDQRIVGFALEEEAALDRRAQSKLKRKHLDAIVANPLATMGARGIRARVFCPDGSCVSPPASNPHDALIDKAAFAAWLIDWIRRVLWVAAP